MRTGSSQMPSAVPVTTPARSRCRVAPDGAIPSSRSDSHTIPASAAIDATCQITRANHHGNQAIGVNSRAENGG
nr:hypothetical protein [Nakamurella alba]